MTRSISSSSLLDDNDNLQSNHDKNDDECIERICAMLQQERNGGYWIINTPPHMMQRSSTSSSSSSRSSSVSSVSSTILPNESSSQSKSRYTDSSSRHEHILRKNYNNNTNHEKIVCPTNDDLDDITSDTAAEVPCGSKINSKEFHNKMLTSVQQTNHHHDATKMIDIIDCRTKMITWCYELIEICHMKEETVEIAVSIFDRFMYEQQQQQQQQASFQSTRKATKDPFVVDVCQSAVNACWYNKKVYQLMAMSALYIAIKINELTSLHPKTLASKLSRNTYTSIQIENMEAILLESLHWKIHVPTIHSYVYEYINYITYYIPSYELFMNQCGHNTTTLHSLINKQIKLAVLHYDYITLPKSVIAYCCIVNAIEIMYHQSNCCHYQHHYDQHYQQHNNIVSLLRDMKDVLLINIILLDISHIISIHKVEEIRNQLYEILVLLSDDDNNIDDDNDDVFFPNDNNPTRKHSYKHHVRSNVKKSTSIVKNNSNLTSKKASIIQHTPKQIRKMMMMHQEKESEYNTSVTADSLDTSLNELSISTSSSNHDDDDVVDIDTEKTSLAGIVVSPSSAIVTTERLS